MIEVKDQQNLPPDARIMMEAFEVANIPYKVITGPDYLFAAQNSPDFAIFLGPLPIKWR